MIHTRWTKYRVLVANKCNYSCPFCHNEGQEKQTKADLMSLEDFKMLVDFLLTEDIEELKILKVFLESEAFWYYLFHTSKPYSKGYMALAKNYIVNFTIPELSEKEKAYLLDSHTREELDEFVWEKYKCKPINA